MSRKTSTVTAILSDAVESEERELVAHLRAASPIWDLIEYHLGWGGPEGGPKARPGKRVRPLLCLLVNQALGGEVAPVLPLAAALELLHNAALIFDDIQDSGAVRRGRPALWRVCGVPQAMNVGVAIQGLVSAAAARAMTAGLPPERVVGAVEDLGQCTLRLCEGQFQDLSFQSGVRPSIDDYMRMCGAKTASLLATGAYLGAYAAGRDDVSEAARRLGYHLGMYLQIEDDIAGIWGDASAMGKAAADLESRKKTLPLLYMFQLDDAPTEVAALARRFFGPEALPDEEMCRLRQYAVDLGGRAYADEMAGFHRDLSRRALEDLGVGRSDLLVMLDELAASLVAAV
ncbi:MAG TPA: polyprenyl synthetase family protein [Bacillota bacterium]|nr:polyprenyl synthetase family protein [Bacillota bacterium]